MPETSQPADTTPAAGAVPQPVNPDGLWLGDLAVGYRFASDEYELTKAEMTEFAARYDPQAFHLDAAAATGTFFDGLVASGWHTAAITMRLFVQALPIATGIVGAGGEVAWPTAAVAGDVLHVAGSVENIIVSRSRPGRAVVLVAHQTANQRGEVRQKSTARLIAWSPAGGVAARSRHAGILSRGGWAAQAVSGLIMILVEWLNEEAGPGWTERAFRLRRGDGVVPGVLWSPADGTPRATALLLHGGSGHKRAERHLRMGRGLAAAAGLAVIAVDGPYHGDRVTAPVPAAVYQRLIVDEGIGRVTARMTADWLESLTALAGLGLARESRVSVFGMSMGARFGLPVAAALGSRLQCAVLGKFGLREEPPLVRGLRAAELTEDAARAITAPVLFHVQWADAIFPRAGQFELFDALGSAGKHLVARSGPHDVTRPEDETAWTEFIGRNAG